MLRKITLFTPTYNRAQLLPRLYKSICEQKFEDFEWLIVDDGSTDDTRDIIMGFVGENIIPIKYVHQVNGGKHAAVNTGVRYAEGKLFLIIDSDDYLYKDALEIISTKFLSVENDPKICGVIGHSAYTDGSMVGTPFPQDNWQVSFSDVYLKYGVKGDKAVAFKTDIIRQYPFPVQKDVRFVFEAVVWHEMSKKYQVLAINEVLQGKEYINEGLTDSSNKKWYVTGLAFSYYYLIKNNTHPFLKYPRTFLWNYIYLSINSRLSGSDYFTHLRWWDKILYLLLYPRAYCSFTNLKKLLHD